MAERGRRVGAERRGGGMRPFARKREVPRPWEAGNGAGDGSWERAGGNVSPSKREWERTPRFNLLSVCETL